MPFHEFLKEDELSAGEPQEKIVLRCGHWRRDERKTVSSHYPHLLGPNGSGGPRFRQGLQAVPGGGREWNWRETNTEHFPGIQPADVQELLEKGSKVVVLSRGMQLMLWTCPETLQLLKDKGIGVHVEETRKAAELYNKLAKSEPVGGLFHSTC